MNMADGDVADLGMCETVSITINPFTSEIETGEVRSKKARLEDINDITNQPISIKQMMLNINRAICLRLDVIENKLETVQNKTRELEEKVDTILNHLLATQNANQKLDAGAERLGNIVVGVPSRTMASPGLNGSLSEMGCESDTGASMPLQKLYEHLPTMSNNITLITLNREEDYPNGSWLGDETNPEMRVRVPITPSDLLHIHSNCRTAEKMALTFLDYLFDRETQASSNLSGMGKHGKKQLDPLMIYGIRCHLIQRFSITEQDWHRIKQNVDSKCRTAFRRKQRGLPLTVKAFRAKSAATGTHQQYNMRLDHFDLSHSDEDSLQHSEDSELHIQGSEDIELNHDSVIMGNIAHIMQSPGGSNEIQVVHATPEQMAQLQQSHQIQIVQGDLLQHLNSQEGEMSIRVSLPQMTGPGVARIGGRGCLVDPVVTTTCINGLHSAIGGRVSHHHALVTDIGGIETIVKGEPGLDHR